MRRTKLSLLAGLFAITGISTLLLAIPSDSQAAPPPMCTNTFCAPGEEICSWSNGWNCWLDSQGCLAISRCDIAGT